MLVRISLISVGLLAAAAANADLAFSSYGPGNSFNTTGWTISTLASPLNFNVYMAEQFTSATTGELSALSFGYYHYYGGNLTVGIYADNGNNQVGATLGTWDVSATTDGGAICNVPVSAGINLAAGQKYWVGLIPHDDTWIMWGWRSDWGGGLLQRRYLTSTDTLGDLQSAFSVETQAVPEPTTIAAMSLGALGLLRRRKRA